MHEFIALEFNSREQADGALAVAMDAAHANELDLSSVALAYRGSNGRVKVEQEMGHGGSGMLEGGLLGLLIGLLLGGPLVALVGGAALGGAAAKLMDLGIDEVVVRHLTKSLESGHVLIFAVVNSDGTNGGQVAERLAAFEPRVVHTSLFHTDEAQLSDALTPDEPKG